MDRFMERYGLQVKGSLSGWDRIALRGTIRWLSSKAGLASYLSMKNILLKDFGRWAEGLTRRVRQGCEQVADALGIRRLYLRSSSTDKEALARAIAKQEGIGSGPICMFSVVDPSYSPTVVGNRESKKLEVEMRPRKCVWTYFYWNDPQLGFGHLRQESWLPFTIKGSLNGRHGLERRLMAEGMDYVKSDNCFRWVADVARAQALLDEQLRADWPALLNGMVDRYFGVMRELFGPTALDYYWSADETEWATDVMFRDTATLDRLFPMLARHALTVSDSASVMRYLGKIAPGAALPPRLTGDRRGDRRRRHEGLCVKHWAGGNSVKAYNKAGNVLRVETTINHPRRFKSFRPRPGADGKGKWLPMRKGVADLEARSRISQKSNERYLDALAGADTDATFHETIASVSRPTQRNKRSARALNLGSEPDLNLLRFLAQGQWSLNGFRNRDLALWTEPKANALAPADRKRLAARVTRRLWLLRAHGLIKKIPKTHRYVLTPKGAQIATLMLSVSSAQTKRLMEKAA